MMKPCKTRALAAVLAALIFCTMALAACAPTPPPAPKTADQLFEERLKAFMSESDSKISGIKQYSDHRTRSRRR